MLKKRLKNKIITICKELKDTNPYKAKHFSFVIQRTSILSMGQNSYDKTHTMAKKLNYRFATIHSELDAINNLKRDPTGLDMINVRINSQGKLRMSRPCSKCLNLLNKVGIRKVWHTNWDGDFVLMKE